MICWRCNISVPKKTLLSRIGELLNGNEDRGCRKAVNYLRTNVARTYLYSRRHLTGLSEILFLDISVMSAAYSSSVVLAILVDVLSMELLRGNSMLLLLFLMLFMPWLFLPDSSDSHSARDGVDTWISTVYYMFIICLYLYVFFNTTPIFFLVSCVCENTFGGLIYKYYICCVFRRVNIVAYMLMHLRKCLRYIYATGCQCDKYHGICK